MTVWQNYDSTHSQQTPCSTIADEWSKTGRPPIGMNRTSIRWRQQTFAPALREPSRMLEYDEVEEPSPMVAEISEVCAELCTGAELCTVKEEEESDISDQTPVPEPEAEFEMGQSSRSNEAHGDNGAEPLDETLLRLQRKVSLMLDAYGVGTSSPGDREIFDVQENFNDDIEFLEVQRRLLQRRLRVSEQRRRNLEQENKELHIQLQNAISGGGGSSPSSSRSEKRREDTYHASTAPRQRHVPTSTRDRNNRPVGSPSPPKKRPEKMPSPPKKRPDKTVVAQDLAGVQGPTSSRSLSRSAFTASGSLRPVLEKAMTQEQQRPECRFPASGRAPLEAQEAPSMPRAEEHDVKPELPLAHERVQARNGRSAHCPPADHYLEIGGFMAESEASDINCDISESVTSSTAVPLATKSRVGPGRGLIWPSMFKSQVPGVSTAENKSTNPQGAGREVNAGRPRQRIGDVLSAARRHSRDSGRSQLSGSLSPKRIAASPKRLARSASSRAVSPKRQPGPTGSVPRPSSRPNSSRTSKSHVPSPVAQVPSCAFNPDSYMGSRMLP